MTNSSEMGANVSSGLSVDFYWVDNPSFNVDDHIEQAVDTLFAAISNQGVRLWSPFVEPLVKDLFRSRIKKAMQGALEPPEEFKSVGDGREPIFEIRWSEIDVHDRGANGEPDQYYKVEVRLLHAEPLALGVCALGLHAHEKWTSGTKAEIKAEQDRHIAHARAIYLQAQPRGWGVTQRPAG